MGVHRRRRREPDGLADLAHGRWVAVLVDVRLQVLPDLLLPVRQHRRLLSERVFGQGSQAAGRRQDRR